jgi:hypothetical protein
LPLSTSIAKSTVVDGLEGVLGSKEGSPGSYIGAVGLRVVERYLIRAGSVWERIKLSAAFL